MSTTKIIPCTICDHPITPTEPRLVCKSCGRTFHENNICAHRNQRPVDMFVCVACERPSLPKDRRAKRKRIGPPSDSGSCDTDTDTDSSTNTIYLSPSRATTSDHSEASTIGPDLSCDSVESMESHVEPDAEGEWKIVSGHAKAPRLQPIVLLLKPCDMARPLTSLKYKDVIAAIELAAGGKLLAINFEKAGHITIRTAQSDQAQRLLTLTSISQIPVVVRYPGTDKSFQGQIRGVGLYIPIEMVLNELRDVGVTHVSRAIRYERRGGEIISSLRTTLNLTFAKQDLPEKNHLGCQTHTVYPFMSSPPQCFKCQHFGHLLSSCRGNVACRKCAGKHMTKTCTSSFIKCILCGQGHTATYSRCPVRLHHLAIHRRALSLQAQTSTSAPSPTALATSAPMPSTAGDHATLPNTVQQTPVPQAKSYADALRAARREVSASRLLRRRSRSVSSRRAPTRSVSSHRTSIQEHSTKPKPTLSPTDIPSTSHEVDKQSPTLPTPRPTRKSTPRRRTQAACSVATRVTFNRTTKRIASAEPSPGHPGYPSSPKELQACKAVLMLASMAVASLPHTSNIKSTLETVLSLLRNFAT